MNLFGLKAVRIRLLHFLVSATTLLCLSAPSVADAQTSTNDTIYSPKVNYTIPRKYEIAGITVSGADNFDDYVIIGFSGLTVGETIKIPGDEISQAIKRFWKQGLFSDVAITLTKTVGNKAWLNIALTQQPRVSDVRYIGIKKSDKDELEGRVGIIRGGQINLNLIDKAEKVKVQIRRIAPPYLYFASETFEVGPEWKPFAIECTIGEKFVAKEFCFMIDLNGGTNYYFDDFTVEEIEKPATGGEAE